MDLTQFDKALLNIVQTGLPLSGRPFAELAEKLGSDEDTVIKRLAELKEAGVIRRLGAFFDAASLGYAGTLAALKASAEDLPLVAAKISAYKEITHNYQREGPYSLWFTVQAPDQESLDKVLQSIGAIPGVRELISLPAVKRFKINVEFSLK